MSDLINRQDAIDAIEHHKIAVLGERDYDDGIACGYATAHRHIADVVRMLPSAQPDACENTCEITRKSNDCISRQDAINALDCINGVEEVLKSLPSAEPDFDTVAKIDKAHDDGYKQGYLQGKADYERKTGKWIEVHGFCTPGGDPVWACSECGKGIHVYGIEHGTYGADVSDGQWKACPNCGARMLKEGEEHV